MDKVKLNSLATKFKSTNCQETFREIHAMFEPHWRRSVKRDANRTIADTNDVYSLYGLSLWEAVAAWDEAEGECLHFVNRWINGARSNLQRVNIRRVNKERPYEPPVTDGEDDVRASDIASNYNLEEHALDNMYKKKEPNKLELVESLLRSVKTNSSTTLIVEAYRNAPLSASPNSIAKSIGLHHETVKRKLTALSRNYDANRFGDIREYLAV